MRRLILAMLALVVGVVGLGGVVATPAPAGAAVATAMTIAGPDSVASGASATITGRLTAGRTGLSGRPVTLYRVGSGPVTSVGTATTNSLGTVTLTVSNLTATTSFQWVYLGLIQPDGGGYTGSSSPIHTVQVSTGPSPDQTFLTIAGPDSVPLGGSAQITTQLRAYDPRTGLSPLVGQTVTLSRSVDGTTWTQVGTAVTDADGRASRVDAPLTETRQYRWAFAGDRDYQPAISPTHTVVVTSGPDPNDPAPTALSIHTKPPYIATGQSTMIEGVLWSGGERISDEEVSLRESTDSGTSWTTIATETTGDDGLAATIVSPTQNTLYQWRYAGGSEYRWSTSPSAGVTINDEAPTTLTIEVEPSPAYEEETVTISGVLTSAAGPRVNRTVALEASTDGGTTFEEVGRSITDGAGRGVWAFVATETGTTTYRWRFDGTPALSPAVSAPATLEVLAKAPVQLAITASSSRIVHGDNVRLRAALSSGGDPLPDRQVELWEERSGEDRLIDTAVTGPTGRASLGVEPDTTTTYFWLFRPATGLQGRRSADLEVGVAFRVTARARANVVKSGQRVYVIGTVTPFVAGTVVALVRRPSLQRSLDTATVSSTGRFTLSVKAGQAGDYRFAVRARASANNLAGLSKDVLVVVK